MLPPASGAACRTCNDRQVTTDALARAHRFNPVLRGEETRVKPLELFFDLVFVLAFTQCTALMSDEPTWAGLAKGVLVLGVLWWCWGGYAWLTSVIDPEEGLVRIAIFVSMAGLLVVALCVPEAFGDLGLLFAAAYGVVRLMHIVLFWVASRDDAELRKAVVGLLAGTAVGVSLLTAASFADGWLQGGLWALALTLDVGGPLLIAPERWRMAPSHFAERFGLIIIIALGESIVAIGVGAEGVDVDAGVITAAVLGVAVAAALWWLYFDVVALVAERRLVNAPTMRARMAMARDSYSYLHYPMIAGIVLIALGLKKTLGHTEDALKLVPAAAMYGGAALYLLAHVAFRLRNVHSLNRRRLACAILLLALIPVATEVAALAALAVLAALLCALIAYEAVRYADARDRVRHQLAEELEAPRPQDA